MGLQSMTGFARASATGEGASVGWELKSVNGKTLEARLRMPPGFERLEQPARQILQKRFARGNIQATLTLSREEKSAQPVVNESLLRRMAELAGRLEKEYGAAPATSAQLLALRGVMEAPEALESDEERAGLDRAILQTLEDAARGLEEARRSEGAALQGVLLAHVETIDALRQRAEADPSRDILAIRARLSEQVRLLLEASPALDEARLHTEAAILATKADLREELDRLKIHVEAARQLLMENGAVGRKLDFLAQEFNRESNTLCS
ncbi:MAG TPA: YicC/YloC family endoribonuclease, partial [Tianweitania sediminis]|nr:YicC/YloC family endoribonuclease [Tianweitania sediminis]